MKKNEIYNITIEDMGNDGEGIGHIMEAPDKAEKDFTGKERSNQRKAEPESRGIAVFVKDTVVGDVVSVRIVKMKKQYAYGRLEKIISPSPYRVQAPCANARSCGGCTLMHMSYEKQLEYKWNKVRNCLERIGGLENAGALMEPIHGMRVPYRYRNKMQFPVGLDKNGRVQIGFYAGRTHSIINLEDCEIGHPVNAYILKELRVWLQDWQDKTGTFIYDEVQHKGLVRHVLTRVGFATGELMVCVVMNGADLPSASLSKRTGKKPGDIEKDCSTELAEHMRRAVELYNGKGRMDRKTDAGEIVLKSLTINRNREQTNRILGDTCKTLWGEAFITDYIGDICFRISPMSFYQVNPEQTRLLYAKTLEYADLSGQEVVWDMYCGIGTISLCLAKKAKKVYGVEIVPQAIEDAKENAVLNGIDNTEFFCGKAEEVVPEFYRRGENAGGHPDVVVVDPPRKGCEEVLLQTIAAMAPKRLVYVSCDPATLARDVKRFGELGYEVKKAAVYDQFGHSGHVETIVSIQKKNS
ncbi:MAG: 23S rRNA (uracil(1939)-C(5))-methyltransferase RlmD [Bacteroides sp.]|nr:23S rRNA (uracil(1939)-C(5))-methyltransferase RlmD [Bacteroides sp.]MCM1548907.1 23S rRNA (uracil(1939)-C(5))-methyltransferase RlmD [Clostridium sp.]